jgi:hypothetical protein
MIDFSFEMYGVVVRGSSVREADYGLCLKPMGVKQQSL